jgi:hypothetical protein
MTPKSMKNCGQGTNRFSAASGPIWINFYFCTVKLLLRGRDQFFGIFFCPNPLDIKMLTSISSFFQFGMQLLTFIKKDEEHKSFLVSMNEERRGAGRAVGVASATDWKGPKWHVEDWRWTMVDDAPAFDSICIGESMKNGREDIGGRGKKWFKEKKIGGKINWITTCFSLLAAFSNRLSDTNLTADKGRKKRGWLRLKKNEVPFKNRSNGINSGSRTEIISID